jgi:hypothetical protein
VFSPRLSIRGPELHVGGCSPHEVKNYGYNGKEEKNVDEKSCDMKNEKTA